MQARESCQIQQCLQTEPERTACFQRGMPLINQHLTAMLKRKERKKSRTGKISLGLRQMYFYNNNFEGWETVRQGETETVFVNFAATLDEMSCRVTANSSGMDSHNDFSFWFILV